MRSVSRATGTSFDTVLRLLVAVGEVCEDFHNERVENVDVEGHHIQLDEQWAFIYAKDKGIKRGRVKKPLDFAGSAWTWIAMDSDTKLVLSLAVGLRTEEFANLMLGDLASRIKGRARVTSDGFNAYDYPVFNHLRQNTSGYVQLVKIKGKPDHIDNPNVVRYKGSRKERMFGSTVLANHNTSIVERLNLTTRMQNKRFTRRTNAFSKKAANHIAQLHLYFVWYNWIRPHTTLTKRNGTKTTPAMEAGLTDRLWTWEEFLSMADAKRPRKTKYKKHTRPKARARNAQRRSEREAAVLRQETSDGGRCRAANGRERRWVA